MNHNLVTLLTPMYNTGNYVHRLLESVLSQTYPCIEMIVIDDGSTDNSKAVVLDYIKRFEQYGYTLTYSYQANSGQSVAINNGLKMVHGQYLAWPDSDDFYSSPDSISMMVSALQNAPQDVKMVRTQETLLEDGTFRPIGLSGKNVKSYEDASLFEDCLLAKNGFYFCPGAYLVDFNAVKETTNLDIYTSKNAGQNWQLMLPILYKYRCMSIPQELYSVVVRLSSHSRGQYQGYEASVEKFAAYYKTQIETLKRIKGFPADLINKYDKLLVEDYNQKLFWIAVHSNNRKAASERLYAKCSGGGISRKKISLRYCCSLKEVPICLKSIN